MSLRTAAQNPWAFVVAATFGGLTWAVGAHPFVGLLVFLLVYGVAVGASLMIGSEDSLPLPPHSSPARAYLDRSQAALARLDSLTRSAKGAARSQVLEVSRTAHDTLDAFHRIASQVSALESAHSQVNASAVSRELSAVRSRMHVASPSLLGELRSTEAALSDQLAVAIRLEEAHSMALARLQTVTVSLEGLVARLAEVLAMASATHDDLALKRDVTGLSDELDGLRTGLAETEEVSRKALLTF